MHLEKMYIPKLISMNSRSNGCQADEFSHAVLCLRHNLKLKFGKWKVDLLAQIPRFVHIFEMPQVVKFNCKISFSHAQCIHTNKTKEHAKCRQASTFEAFYTPVSLSSIAPARWQCIGSRCAMLHLKNIRQ